MVTDDKKFRVACAKDFVGIIHSGEPIEESIIYYFTSTLEEAIELAKGFAKKGIYQFDAGGESDVICHGQMPGNTPNPNVAVIEYWDEDENDWLTWVDF